MAKIALDVEKMKRLHSGLGQFCAHLGKNLLSESDLDITFYIPSAQKNVFGENVEQIIQKEIHKISGVKTNCDLWHCTHQEVRYLPSNKKTKLLLTIHDLNFLSKYQGAKQKRKLKRLQQLVDKAVGIAFISKYTEEVARKHLKIGNVPTEVIYNGIAIGEEVPMKPSFVDEQDKFFFTIGIVGEKKNFLVLVDMMKYFPQKKLIIAGNKETLYAKKIAEKINTLGLEKNVLLVGEITEGEKKWLYTHCQAFVFPSLNEGFGLPVIEAMYFGRPVIISKFTSLPEVGGEEAYYFEGFNAENMAKVVRTAISENSEQKKEALKNRASLFSWAVAARQYDALYKKVLENK